MSQNKLSEQDVLEIRQTLAEGRMSQTALARKYGVSGRTIYEVAQKLAHRAVGGPDPAAPIGKTNTRYWGVTADGTRKLFTAAFRHNGTSYRLGIFRSAEEAARAYDDKAQALGIPARRLNFPDELP